MTCVAGRASGVLYCFSQQAREGDEWTRTHEGTLYEPLCSLMSPLQQEKRKRKKKGRVEGGGFSTHSITSAIMSLASCVFSSPKADMMETRRGQQNAVRLQ